MIQLGFVAGKGFLHTGKSKSFDDLTKLGNMRTEEIVKKEKTAEQRCIAKTEELKKRQKTLQEDENAEDAEKSKGGASGSQSDHSMAEAGLHYFNLMQFAGWFYDLLLSILKLVQVRILVSASYSDYECLMSG